MNWQNVKLILLRETRDQLRDRRTLFMIAVLPLLLYPLLGTILLKVTQFRGEHPTKIWLIGGDQLPESPALLEKTPESEVQTGSPPWHFAESLLSRPDDKKLLQVTVKEVTEPFITGDLANEQLRNNEADAVVIFPADFAQRLSEFRQSLRDRANAEDKSNEKSSDKSAADNKSQIIVPDPVILYDASKEKSQLARARVADVLRQWTEAIGQQNLIESRVPELAARPFESKPKDIATDTGRDAALWSKILPFIVLIWALTGAFYPAVDLCAGEKERGTLETLLSSPAHRSEIATGKLLTIMLFSVATSLLNLLSMGITSSFVVTQIGHLYPNLPLNLPSPLAAFWLIAALVPMSALFSALCLALAAFAKSSKEGQYYLMPLLIITMPLVMVPMLPGTQLDLGNSLIPVTNVVLLLRMLLEGSYMQALPYVAPVVLVTLLCCLLATRWAIDQFNSESVLFRESERLDLSLWMRHLLRDREDTPQISAAVMCGVLILVINFYMQVKAQEPTSFAEFARQTLILQLAGVLTPVLLMTVMLTRSPVETLLLKKPRWQTVPLAILLAVAAHPLVMELTKIIYTLYPLNRGVVEAIGKYQAWIDGEQRWWLVFAVFALLPAVVEELTFRGFILSGFRHTGVKWRAIALSSVFFGLTHGAIQQSLLAMILGLVIGYIAVQTGSILPGICYHVTHNALTMFSSRIKVSDPSSGPLSWLFRVEGKEGLQYQPAVIVLFGLIAAGILWWFHKLSYPKTREEVLQEAIRQHAADPLPGS